MLYAHAQLDAGMQLTVPADYAERAAYILRVALAMKAAFADRHDRLGDPLFVDVPLEWMTSKDWVGWVPGLFMKPTERDLQEIAELEDSVERFFLTMTKREMPGLLASHAAISSPRHWVSISELNGVRSSTTPRNPASVSST